MSIASRITSIEEHIGDVYDTLELGGAELTNTDKNLVNISPILRQKYIDYMNNGTREIWDNWEKVTGTGSRVTLNNTIQAPMDLGVKGNTTQNQYEGKNLLPNTLEKGYTTTINGITYKVNDDLSVKVTGTASATSYIRLNANITYTLPAGTYTFSKNSNQCELAMWHSSSSILDTIGNNTTSKTITITQDTTYTDFRTLIVVASGNTVDTTIYPMLEQGSTATSYEPYVGGTASPNPSYPQTITNVTGDVEVLVQNKNLFDKDNANTLNGNINSSGEIVSNSNARTIYISCKSSTTYTVSKILSTQFRVSVYDTIPVIGATGTNTIANFTGTSITITSTANSKYLAVFLYASNSDTLTLQQILNSIQIEQGTTATTYTPHKEQSFTFPLGTQRMFLGDYLADDGIHHVRKQAVLDGSEDEPWWVRSDTHEMRSSVLSSFNATYGSNILCNQLIQVNSATAGANGVRWVLNSQDICIHSNDLNTSTMTAAEWRQYLSENPLVMEFGISTEEITPYTEPQQTAYDEIKQAISYDEQTNISGTSDGAEPILDIVALKNS